MFAYNTTRHESTGFSPFYLLYGGEPMLPADLSFGVDPNPLIPLKEVSQSYVHRLKDHLESARRTVLVRKEQVKMKQKGAYDATRREASYKKGDLVLIWSLQTITQERQIRKIAPPLVGTLVVRKTTRVNYEVILKDGWQNNDIGHVARMKPFFELDSLTDEDSGSSANTTIIDPTMVANQGSVINLKWFQNH